MELVILEALIFNISLMEGEDVHVLKENLLWLIYFKKMQSKKVAEKRKSCFRLPSPLYDTMYSKAHDLQFSKSKGHSDML